MSCFLENEKGERRAVMVFKRSALLYDIGNCLYVEGSVLPGETEPHLRHSVQDGTQDGNVDRVTRVMDRTVAKCKEMLFPYTRYELEREVVDNRFREEPVYGIVLSVPEDFSQTTLDYMEKLIHDLILDRAVADWLSMTHPQKSPLWTEKGDEAERELRVCMGKRIRRIRRRVSPF